jgi:hypothetical protein
MPSKPSRPAQRKPRTDALHNRRLILEVAKDAFTRHGASASLDDIAKDAGVGPKRAIKSGDPRKDLNPFDLPRAVIGVSNVATTPDWQQSARRLVDILIAGSRR